MTQDTWRASCGGEATSVPAILGAKLYVKARTWERVG